MNKKISSRQLANQYCGEWTPEDRKEWEAANKAFLAGWAARGKADQSVCDERIDEAVSDSYRTSAAIIRTRIGKLDDETT